MRRCWKYLKYFILGSSELNSENVHAMEETGEVGGCCGSRLNVSSMDKRKLDCCLKFGEQSLSQRALFMKAFKLSSYQTFIQKESVSIMHLLHKALVFTLSTQFNQKASFHASMPPWSMIRSRTIFQRSRKQKAEEKKKLFNLQFLWYFSIKIVLWLRFLPLSRRFTSISLPVGPDELWKKNSFTRYHPASCCAVVHI